MATPAAISGAGALRGLGRVRPRSLDGLADCRERALATLYAEAEVPALAELDGDLRGRMLALRGTGFFWFTLLRAFAAWRHFPWRGKSFKVRSDCERGDGINRVFGDVRPRRWFRFETRIGPSRADAGAALTLDYDNADNPFFIRPIKDELRRVRPGLFLGQAYLMLLGKPRLVLYFALEAPT